jgi:hypothetical protein
MPKSKHGLELVFNPTTKQIAHGCHGQLVLDAVGQLRPTIT